MSGRAEDRRAERARVTGPRRARSREEADSGSPSGMPASCTGHAMRFPASGSPQVGALGFSVVSCRGGWVPFFTLSLPTLATAGYASGRAQIRLYCSQSRWKGSDKRRTATLTCNRRPRKPGEGPSRERQDLGGAKSIDRHSETRPGIQGSADTGPCGVNLAVEETQREGQRRLETL